MVMTIKDFIEKAKHEVTLLKHPYLGSEHAFLVMLKSFDENIMSEIDCLCSSQDELNYENFKNALINEIGVGSTVRPKSEILNTPLFSRVLENTLKKQSKKVPKDSINLLTMLICILEEGEGVAVRLLMKYDCDFDALIDFLARETAFNKDELKNRKLLLSMGCFVDLRKTVAEEKTEIIGMDNELEQLMYDLIRLKKPNVILLGKAGVGKTALVEKLACKINNGEVIDQLQDKQLFQLYMNDALAGTKYRGEFEEKMKKMLDILEKDPNIIIFIDEIHTMAKAGDNTDGGLSAGNIMKPALSRGKMKVIGATTFEEYDMTIAKDSALQRRFAVINVDEPTIEEVFEILKGVRSRYENYYDIIIPDKEIKNVLKRSVERKGMFPDKALDEFEEWFLNRLKLNNKEGVKSAKN